MRLCFLSLQIRVVDYFRSCDGGSLPCDCTYDLCLTCCRELRAGLQPGGDEAESAQEHSEAKLTNNDMLEEDLKLLPRLDVLRLFVFLSIVM